LREYKTAKVRRYVRFVMYCFIITCWAECCCHCSPSSCDHLVSTEHYCQLDN